MKTKTIAVLGLLAVFCGKAYAEEAKYSGEEVQNRMNQIYYWHLAEELNISADQEKGMVKVLEESQKQRLDLLSKRDELLATLKKLTDKPGATPALLHDPLANFEKTNESLSKVDRQEFNSLRKIFGDQALARFLVVRDSITERLRDSLRKTPVAQSSR